jgi:hypothetical protein
LTIEPFCRASPRRRFPRESNVETNQIDPIATAPLTPALSPRLVWNSANGARGEEEGELRCVAGWVARCGPLAARPVIADFADLSSTHLEHLSATELNVEGNTEITIASQPTEIWLSIVG